MHCVAAVLASLCSCRCMTNACLAHIAPPLCVSRLFLPAGIHGILHAAVTALQQQQHDTLQQHDTWRQRAATLVPADVDI